MSSAVTYKNEREAQAAYRRAAEAHRRATLKAAEAAYAGADEDTLLDLEAHINSAKRAMFKIIADARRQGFYRVNV